MARPERFELPTARFVAEYSIQLSYGRVDIIEAAHYHGSPIQSQETRELAEREGFEPSMEL